jgi:hypothetical protein
MCLGFFGINPGRLRLFIKLGLSRDLFGVQLFLRFAIRWRIRRLIIQHRGNFLPVRLDQIRNPLGQFLSPASPVPAAFCRY